jgi:hypothetical protein
MKKLSPKQQLIFELMKSGWKLTGDYRSGTSYYWLEKTEKDRSQTFKEVGMSTVSALLRRNLIRGDGSVYPIEIFRVMELPQ